MKVKIIEVVVICLLVTFALWVVAVPIHELGHVLAVEYVEGYVNEVCWLSFSPAPMPGESAGSYLGYVIGIYQADSDWIVGLGGGLFQGLIYLILGLILFWIFKIKKRFWEVHVCLEGGLAGVAVAVLMLGVAGIAVGVCEAFGIL